jgi:hypothetical protein
LYPNLFVDHSLHMTFMIFNVKTTLWSDFSLMQSDGKVTYKNEGNVAIPFNSFQYYEEENDIFMNISMKHMHVYLVHLMMLKILTWFVTWKGRKSFLMLY